MSLNLEGFLADVKRAALEAVRASKPFAMTYGTVTSVSPLEIAVDQKLTLRAEQLVLTYAVRDFTVEITVESAADTYRQTVTVHSALKNGERVLLFRADGGQKYVVLDRAEAPT